MGTKVVGFSIPQDEEARLESLVAHFTPGNRSAFLRLAMKQMEVVRRAEVLRDLQTYGVQRRTDAGRDADSVEEIVHRVLAKRRG